MLSSKKSIIAIILCICLIIICSMALIFSMNSSMNSFERSIKFDVEYGKIYYPAKWEDTIRIKSNEDSIEFWAEVGKHDAMHLFDINFYNEDYAVGVITVDSGGKVIVSIKSYEYKFDKSWSSDEKKIIYGMSEDLNFVLDRLDKIKGYEKMY